MIESGNLVRVRVKRAFCIGGNRVEIGKELRVAVPLACELATAGKVKILDPLPAAGPG